MIYRPPIPQEKQIYDQHATHPMQSWAWGEFRRDTGVEVVRMGLFDGSNLVRSYQLTLHTVPYLNFLIGYFPRADQPDQFQIEFLKQVAEKHNLIFIKNEPNIYFPISSVQSLEPSKQYLLDHSHQPGRPMFTPHTFVLDLTRSEEELLSAMKGKTRYNINLARKKGVTVSEDNSQEAFEEYIALWKKTTKRQNFYAHTEQYQRDMWKHMNGDGIARLLKATYKGNTLGIWIVFVFNNILYYPYGASSRENRDVMANNLLAWEAIRYGKTQGCTKFDMWGSLGPNPDPKDPWYGFHRFKEGYGGDLVEFVGTFDYVNVEQSYKIYKFAEKWRWRLLRLRTKLPF